MTRVKRVSDIGNLGAASSLEWEAEDASKYNLVYGWNGSGKTTLSRVFKTIEKGEYYLDGFNEVKFSIKTEDGEVTEEDLKKDKIDVEVFNEDFIEDNISFKKSKTNPIVIIGESNIEVERKIKSLKEDLEKEKIKKDKLEKELEELGDVGGILTECGRRVTKIFSGTPLAKEKYESRSYTKREIKKLLEEKEIIKEELSKTIISDGKKLEALKDQVRFEGKKVSIQNIDIKGLKRLFSVANSLLEKSIETSSIERIQSDKQVREWVREGYKIHKERGESKCLFCSSKLTDELMSRYGQLFTKEVSESEEKLLGLVARLEDKVESMKLSLPDSSLFFTDLADEYTPDKRRVNESLENVRSKCEELLKRLRRRQGKMQIESSRQEPVEYPSDEVDRTKSLLESLESLCEKQNERVRAGREEIQKAARKVELHIVSSYLKESSYFKKKRREEELKEDIGNVETKIADIKQKISEKKGELRDTSIAVKKINSIVEEFLGKGEVELSLPSEDVEDRGYEVKRNGEVTRYLSDGEKSILALSYFLVSLESESCDIEKTVVVLDDPVDSQDNVFLFRTYGLIRKKLDNAKQFFLFTHNYELFNLVRDWFKSKNVYDKSCMYWMEMRKKEGGRSICIENLPRILEEHKSEYQHLFGKIYKYKRGLGNVDPTVIPNISRKVLEHFSSFKWSCTSRERLSNIITTRFVKSDNPNKQSIGHAVLKFLHEYSHGGNFNRSVTSSVMESEAIADNILELIYLSDEDHYESVKNEIEKHIE